MNPRIIALDYIRKLDQWSTYKSLLQNQYLLTSKDIDEYTEKSKNSILNFHIQKNPIYSKFLINSGLRLENIDFEDLPIIKKSDLKKLCPVVPDQVHKRCHTGGSTGAPFTYTLSRRSLSHMWPNLWRAFGVCGVNPGEKMLMIAGPSLFNNRSIKRKIYDLISNFFILSAFEMNDKTISRAINIVKKNKIRVIYGYSSSILNFLKYLEKTNTFLDLKGIFSTSESFIPSIRQLALSYCNCNVIDIYGANDGGILAFSCECNDGYHVSHERTYLEIIDNKIILTDLLNTSYPFIRYEVGDTTTANELIKEKCNCGRTLYRLPNVSGRINDFITNINGTMIHSEFFTHLFYGDSHIEQFQITETVDDIIINLITKKNEYKYFKNKYYGILLRKIDKKISIVLNQELNCLPNKKTPILYKCND